MAIDVTDETNCCKQRQEKYKYGDHIWYMLLLLFSSVAYVALILYTGFVQCKFSARVATFKAANEKCPIG